MKSRLLCLFLCLSTSASYIYTMDIYKTDRPPVGLVNGGDFGINNRCFINAVIQCMSNMRIFSDTLLKKADLYKYGTVARSYINLIQELAVADSPVDAIPFCIEAWKTMGFEPNSAQDSSEFFALLCKHLACIDLHQYLRNQRAVHPAMQLINLRIAATLNNNGYLEKEPFKDVPFITLNIAPGVTSIYDCLDANFKTTTQTHFGGTYKLERKVGLDTTPKYCVLFLPRLTTQNPHAKNMTSLSFALDNCSLKKYVIDKPYYDSTYRLIGCVIHNGTAEGGHFSAYIRRGNAWYLCNDAHVERIPNQTMEFAAAVGYGINPGNVEELDEQQTPVMFFYERN